MVIGLVLLVVSVDLIIVAVALAVRYSELFHKISKYNLIGSIYMQVY